ncbi:acetyl-CoA hydrolase/transferase C-terminal domain-containing protein [Porphyromonadaceae bacterium W3.11]|nr:acetyl-CoA hydrolase/transferase C-terminal domain-containing protein [Porphyromonadaceae bacterium W3.11]
MVSNKIKSLEAAVSLIQDNEVIVLGHGSVSPGCVVEELVRQSDRFRNLSIFHLIFMGKPLHMAPEMKDHFRVISPFMSGKEMRAAMNEGRADFIPCHFSRVPELFEKGNSVAPDWAVVQVTPPDAQGRYSCSLSTDYTLPAARSAKKVMAIVNPTLPYIGGDNFLLEDEIDVIVEDSTPAYTLPKVEPSDLDQKIAAYCADLIPDRACLQIGIGALPDAVLSRLSGRKDLGVHTELLTPGVLDLYKSGAITGKYKAVHPNKMVASFTIGDKALYDWLDDNDEFEQYPVDYVNNPYVIGQNPNMISINSCVEIDLFGQVCSEKIGGKLFSGSGGQFDYVRGVRLSKGGKSIIATQSTAKGGTVSRIQSLLSKGNVVTTMRNDVDYIVTEYGVAKLLGNTEAERAKQLISVAHPNFREGLEEEARKIFGREIY